MKIIEMKRKLLYRKIFTVFLVLLILNLTFFIKSRADILDDISITFVDTSLYQELKRVLSTTISKSDNDTNTIWIDPTDLQNITELSLNNANITDLSGLENFTQLQTLDLSGNNLVTITPIEPLTKLKVINLTKNPVSRSEGSTAYLDITPLASIESLENINISECGITTISCLASLPYLKVLTAASNSIINEDYSSGFLRLQELNLSMNTSITQFSVFGKLSTNLKKLNVSNTNITDLKDLHNLTGLEEIDISSCLHLTTSNFEVFDYYPNTSPKQYYLSKLKSIKANNLDTNSYAKTIATNIANNAYVFENLVVLELANNGMTTFSNNLAKIGDLDVLNLSLNKISNLDFFIKKETINGAEIYYILNPKLIYLQSNELTAIHQLGYVTAKEYVDVSYNHIDDYTPIVNLATIKIDHQTIDYTVFQKSTYDQFIILPFLFQQYTISSSYIYSETPYVLDNCSLLDNPLYMQDNHRVLVLSKDMIKGEQATIYIPNGRAIGSKLTMTISTATSAIDSVFIQDLNLSEAVQSVFESLYLAEKIDYFRTSYQVTNVLRKDISQFVELNADGREIQTLDGIQSLTSIKICNLNLNQISDLEPLAPLTQITTLYIASNKFSNYDVITNFPKLTTLDISLNQDIINIDPILELQETKKAKLLHLNVANTSISTLNQISLIPTLNSLTISNTKIRNLSNIVVLTNLVYLACSNNYIEDLTPIGLLSNLNTLELNNDNIADITPLLGLNKLSKLSLMSNKITNASSLIDLVALVDLTLDNNYIADTSYFSDSNRFITTFSIAKQKLTFDASNYSGTIRVPLPPLFVASMNNDKYVASAYPLSLEQCTLEGTDLVVNLDDLNNGVAVATIINGNAKNSTFTVGTPISAYITYNPDSTNPTTDYVDATITFDKSNVKILNNEGSNVYRFRKNGSFTFEYVDENGFYGTAVATVDWILNNNLELNVVCDPTTPTQGNVTVTIYGNMELEELDGWILSFDKLSMSKTFTENTSYEVTVIEATGEFSRTISIEVNNIDRTKPKVTGVSNNGKYTKAVTPIITDDSPVTIKLYKDNVLVEGYEQNQTINSNGTFMLIVTDDAGNETYLTFTISGIDETIVETITSEKYLIDETNKEILYVTPGTTLTNFKKLISSNIDYSVLSNGTQLTNTSLIKTGDQLKTINNTVYTIYVYCDFTKKGLLDVINMGYVNKVYVDLDTNYDKLKYLDINKDKKVNTLDKSAINYLHVELKNWEY